MTQNDLNRAVAQATGETIAEISCLGFSLADPDEVRFDPEPIDRMPQVVDWDQLDRRRRVGLFQQRFELAHA